MDDGTKKIIAWVVCILVVVGIFLGIYFGFRNSNFGKAIGSLFGSAAGVGIALDKMIQGCNQKGWANPKACPVGFIGVLAISLTFVYGIVKIYRKFSPASGKGAGLTEKTSATTGKNSADLEDEAVKDVSSEKYDELVEAKGQDIADTTLELQLTKNMKLIGTKNPTQGASAQEIEEVNMAAEAQAQDILDAIRQRGATDDEIDEINEDVENDTLMETSL